MTRLLELAELHLRTLYVFDDEGRMLRETVDEGRVPPRLAVVDTAEGMVCRFRHDVPDDEREALLRLGGRERPGEDAGGGPIYVFPDDIAGDPGVVEISDGIFALKVDGRAVAWCWSSRDIGGAAQAGVETKEAFRGRGFAPRVVATWGAAMVGRGSVPIYSTSRANAASQSVARKLGLIYVGSDVNVF